ncbi:MAG TPA: hypothetical protein V6C97_26475 [Oculatellaceae cyanobacterium]
MGGIAAKEREILVGVAQDAGLDAIGKKRPREKKETVGSRGSPDHKKVLCLRLFASS